MYKSDGARMAEASLLAIFLGPPPLHTPAKSTMISTKSKYSTLDAKSVNIQM